MLKKRWVYGVLFGLAMFSFLLLLQLLEDTGSFTAHSLLTALLAGSVSGSIFGLLYNRLTKKQC